MSKLNADLLIALARAVESQRKCSPVTVKTIEIISKITGSYHVNENTPVATSQNAEYGRLLSRHRDALGIELQGSIGVKDDDDVPSTSACWLVLPNKPDHT